MGLRLIDEQARLPCNKLTEVVCPSIIVRRKKSIESNGVSSYTYINTRASFIFFYYKIMINMSQQETELTLEQVISRMSPEGQMALAKIGVTWKDYAGYFGSIVPHTVLIKMMKQNLPWSANKITQKGQGRNGVLYTLLPMLKEQGLVEEVDGRNYTRYRLTNIGKEVIRSMLYACSSCHQTRECSHCWQGLYYTKDDKGQRQPSECGSESWRSYNAPEHKIDECEHCNEFGHRLCYTCKGTKTCHYCISDDEVE